MGWKRMEELGSLGGSKRDRGEEIEGREGR